MRFLTLALVLLFLISSHVRASGQGYYRYPSVHNDTVVFSAEGDLWKTTLAGGVATRLTTNHGREVFPAISPDGKHIVFLAEYDGPVNLYLMPIAGGSPERLTYSEGFIIPRGWTRDHQVLYATNERSAFDSDFQLVKIHPETRKQSWLPLSQAYEGSFNDQDALFFTRTPGADNFIRHYQGGTAQNIWKYTDGKEAMPLTKDYPGTSNHPVYWNKRVYFVTDRGGPANLWSMDTDGKDLTQHTFHKGQDVGFPSQHNGQFVYQLGPDIYTLDLKLADAQPQKIEITLASDFEQRRARWLPWPAPYLSGYDLSPDSTQLALTARGQVTLLPIKDGRTITIPNPGKEVFFESARYLSETSYLLAVASEGIYQSFWLLPVSGGQNAIKIHQTDRTVVHGPTVSPDNEFFVWSDALSRVWLTHIHSGESEVIRAFETRYSEPHDFSWSPDSQWLTFAAQASNLNDQIYLYSLSENTLTTITDDRTNSHLPLWSHSGKWLMFVSQRFFSSRVTTPNGLNQPEPYSDTTTGIFMYAMDPEALWPFEQENELFQQKFAQVMAREQKQASDREPHTINVQLQGLSDRLYQVPLSPGDYRALGFSAGCLHWLEPDSGNTFTLRSLKIDNDPDNQPFTSASGITGFMPGQSGEQILIHGENNKFALIPAGTPVENVEVKPISLDSWRLHISPQDEWRQLLTSVWTTLRDYFADRSMSGADWPAQLESHLQTLDRVSDRHDLNHLIGDMLSRLGVLHLNLGRGDQRLNDKWSMESSLGAVVTQEENGLTINHIYRTDPNFPHLRSPLARPGSVISEGDQIIAINSLPLDSEQASEKLLTFKGDSQVLLDIKKPGLPEPVQQIVWPLSSGESAKLRYHSWVYHKQRQTEQLGEGRLGYVHLQGLESENFEQWVQQFYPVYNRGGLILDLRYNTGGNIDSWITSRLQRKAVTFNTVQGVTVDWNLPYAFRGHTVVLINEHTRSDAEELAENLRQLGLATIIGTRSWGGTIWMFLSDLMDHGSLTVPYRAGFKASGRWTAENWGVEPDIYIDNLPYATTYNGQDAQLEKAISFLLDQLEKEPVELPQRPDFPITRP